MTYPLKFERTATVFKTYAETTDLPTQVDLRSKCPPILEQPIGGAADAIVSAYQFGSDFAGSRAFHHHNEKDTDSLAESIKIFKKYGICRDEMLQSTTAGDLLAANPPAECYTDALLHRAVTINNIDHDVAQIRQCLASGTPLVLGIMVYSSFSDTDRPPMPNTSVDKLLGGQAVLCVGYDDAAEEFIMRNEQKYFYLPYIYLTNAELTTDLWQLIKVNLPPLPKMQISRPTIKRDLCHNSQPLKNKFQSLIYAAKGYINKRTVTPAILLPLPHSKQQQQQLQQQSPAQRPPQQPTSQQQSQSPSQRQQQPTSQQIHRAPMNRAAYGKQIHHYNSQKNNRRNHGGRPVQVVARPIAPTNIGYVPIAKSYNLGKTVIITASGGMLQMVDVKRASATLSNFHKKKILHQSRPIR